MCWAFKEKIRLPECVSFARTALFTTCCVSVCKSVQSASYTDRAVWFCSKSKSVFQKCWEGDYNGSIWADGAWMLDEVNAGYSLPLDERAQIQYWTPATACQGAELAADCLCDATCQVILLRYWFCNLSKQDVLLSQVIVEENSSKGESYVLSSLY